MVKKINWWLVGILTAFGLIFASISVVNHYLFRTGALDYGLYLNILYDYLHLKFSYFTLHGKLNGLNALADHFSPILFLFAPFTLIFKTYTFIIIQILATLFGGYGVYKLANEKLQNRGISIIIMVQFFGIWALYSAFTFNWYANFFAVMFVPWMVYYYDKKNIKLFSLYFLIIILCKENMALWLFFILIGLIIRDLFFEKRPVLNWIYFYTLFAIVYFVLITFYLMPALADDKPIQLEKYNLLGKNSLDAIYNIFHNPKYIFSLLFESPYDGEIYRGIKSEFYYVLLFSGGFLFFYRPYFIIMLIPLFLQKMYHSSAVVWGISYHYSIEFAPLLSLVLIDFTVMYISKKYKFLFVFCIAIITHLITISTLEKRKSMWYNRFESCYYYIGHYETNLNIKEINTVLSVIPKNATISASSKLAPHLSLRDSTFHFPGINNAEYIACLYDKHDGWPLSHEEYLKKISQLKQSNDYFILKETKDLIIFKRNN